MQSLHSQFSSHIIIFFFILLTVATYELGAADRISINCGSSAATSTALSGREWVGDDVTNPKFSIKGSSSSSSSSSNVVKGDQTVAIDPVPYNTARVSRLQFTYTFHRLGSSGQKLIRLHFNPSSNSNDFVTVEAGPFTLLANFSPSINARALSLTTLVKEFCLITTHENQPLNIIFTPSQKHSYAFINGLEIISLPSTLSYCHGGVGDIGVPVVGQKSVAHIDHTTALETIHRLNVKWDSVPLSSDDIRGMSGMWATNLKQKINNNYNITWKISVDVGFRYLVRLHFSELGIKMAETDRKDFILLINHMIATTGAHILQEHDELQTSLWYKNYMVMVQGHKREGKRDFSISVCSKDEIFDGHIPLEGFEVFKLSNHDNSLASPNPSPPTTTTSRDSSTTNNIIVYVLGRRNAIATLAVTIICLLNVIVHFLRRNLESQLSDEDLKPSNRAKRLCRHFSLSELKSATVNFNEAYVIGKGGFGKVYKGLIDNEQQIVAIKRLKSGSSQGKHEFWTEIDILSELRHVNLVSLIGYCNKNPEMIIVYEYMPRGTLADHLYRLARKNNNYNNNNNASSSLSWKQRLNICIGACRGLEYLHTGHGIIHRDVKTSNILLDENYVAKVSDFGLAKTGSGSELQSQASLNLKGTFGYFDPHYNKTHELTTKSDVYSFGVVLLEVLCGRPALEKWAEEDKQSLSMLARDKISKGEIEQIVDPSLRGEISPESLKAFVRIAERCLRDEPKKRPAMANVVIRLQFALRQQEKAEALVPSDEMTSVADFFPSNNVKTQQEQANSLVPNEMTNAVDLLPREEDNAKFSISNEINASGAENEQEIEKTLLPDEITTTAGVSNASKEQNVTSTLKEQTYSNVMAASGKKTAHKLFRILPWKRTAKPSKNNDFVSKSVPMISRRNVNELDKAITSRVDTTFYEKRTDNESNELTSTPNLRFFSFTEPKAAKRNFRANDADLYPHAEDNVKFSVSNEITNASGAENEQKKERPFPPDEIATTAGVSNASKEQNVTSTLIEQTYSKTIAAAGKKTAHKILRILPWKRTTKPSKKNGLVSKSGPMTSRSTINELVKAITSEKRTDSESNELTSTPNLRIFSYTELRAATRNFRPDTLLGEGGFGTVFKGWIYDDKSKSKSIVAVKKLNLEGLQGWKEWQSEVNFLGRLSHPNLVKLFGYCIENKEQFLLVYEFMERGSLELHLFRRSSALMPLPWNMRLKILIGAARGLAFLHSPDRQVIHRDIKPSNILLDSSYNAKLSDFGLAKSGPTETEYSHVSTRVMGTYGYAAPEYLATGHLYVKSDVYSFGVVILEMLTGLRALDTGRPSGQHNLVNWIKPNLLKKGKLKTVIDSRLNGQYTTKSASQIARLARDCLETDPKNRPSSKEIVEVLEKIDTR